MSWPRPPPAPNYSSYRSEAFVEKFTHEPSDVGWHLRLLNAVHVNAFTPECNLESPPPPGPRTRSWYRRLSPLLYCISVAGRPCPSHSLQRATLRKGSTLSAPTRSHMSRTHSRIYESQGKYRTVAKVGGWVGGFCRVRLRHGRPGSSSRCFMLHVNGVLRLMTRGPVRSGEMCGGVTTASGNGVDGMV